MIRAPYGIVAPMRSSGLTLLLTVSLLGAGCSSPRREIVPVPHHWEADPAHDPRSSWTASDGHAFAGDDLSVLFATDRQPVPPTATGPLWFGSERASRLRYGRLGVRVEVADERRRNLVRATLETVDEFEPAAPARAPARAAFAAALRAELARGDAEDVVIFVHGFNNGFPQAAFRAGLLAAFCGRRCVPLLFSWPARVGEALRGLAGYLNDRESADFAVPHLIDFLRDLERDVPNARLNVVAHSIGAWLVTRALAEMQAVDGTAPHVHNLVLAAADIDFDVFVERVAKRGFDRSVDRVTIYTAPNDRVLQLAQSWVRVDVAPRLGNLDVAELGYLTQPRHVLESVDFVDLSRLSLGFFGHAYFVDHPLVTTDLFRLLGAGLPPDQRSLVRLPQHGPRVWRLVDPGTPMD